MREKLPGIASLQDAIAKNGITVSQIAEVIGQPVSTVLDKIWGEGDLTISEVERIRTALLPDFRMQSLLSAEH